MVFSTEFLEESAIDFVEGDHAEVVSIYELPPEGVVREDLQASDHRLAQELQESFTDEPSEQIEVVAFMKTLTRGVTLMLSSNPWACLNSESAVTFYLSEDLRAMWTNNRLPGFPYTRYQTVLAFDDIVQVFPVISWAQLRATSNFRVLPARQRKMGSDLYSRSFIISLDIGATVAEVRIPISYSPCILDRVYVHP